MYLKTTTLLSSREVNTRTRVSVSLLKWKAVISDGVAGWVVQLRTKTCNNNAVLPCKSGGVIIRWQRISSQMSMSKCPRTHTCTRASFTAMWRRQSCLVQVEGRKCVCLYVCVCESVCVCVSECVCVHPVQINRWAGDQYVTEGVENNTAASKSAFIDACVYSIEVGAEDRLLDQRWMYRRVCVQQMRHAYVMCTCKDGISINLATWNKTILTLLFQKVREEWNLALPTSYSWLFLLHILFSFLI